jgi:hypothetical protein
VNLIDVPHMSDSELEGWADRNLESGDILFCLGNTMVLRWFPLSKVISVMTDSQFSHTAIVSREHHGRWYVYDMKRDGATRTPFPTYMRDNIETFGVKRLRRTGDQREYVVERAVGYCQAAVIDGVRFDKRFDSADDPTRMYCTELTERAYRRSGVILSGKLPFNQFPSVHKFPWAVKIAHKVFKVRPDHRIYVAGNDEIGLWGSDELELVYLATPVPRAKRPWWDK